MQRILIIGAGGHGQVVADILQRMRDAGSPLVPIGYVDDSLHLHGEQRLGLPVFGPIAQIPRVSHDALILGIGSNRVRRMLFEQLQIMGEAFIVARHPSAVVAPDVSIGEGSVICAGAVVNPGTRVGANVILNTRCSVDHHNRIGDHCHIAPGATLGGDVSIGEAALVGIGAIVMPQRSVGAESVVGAGTLVHADLPAHVVALGVPARITREDNTSPDAPPRL